MEPSDAISIIENDLRYLVAHVLEAKYGSGWHALAFSPETIAVLSQRQVEEAKRRAPLQVPSDLVAYTHLYELLKVIKADWEAFKPALGDKREFEVWMGSVEDFRNAPAHSRELLPYEAALLEGIAGLVRTKTVRYRSTVGKDMKHYPIVESIVDGFGNSAALDKKTHIFTSTDLVLGVGQHLTFKCRGWDPQGRELHWKIRTSHRPMGETQIGNEVALEFWVTKENVGENFFVNIFMSSSGEYHRHGSYDEKIVFKYSVEPPS